MKNNDLLFETFSFLSKAVIIMPLVVLVVGLMIKFNQKTKNPPAPTPVVSISPTIKPKTKINIDLKGPFVCQGKINEASVAAYIKDKKIKMVIDRKSETENLLVSGDCFYNWDEGEFSGRRICGLSSLLSVAGTMVNFGGLGVDSLLNQLNNLMPVNKIASDQAKMVDFINRCQKKPVDERNFTIPSNVLFKNNQ